MPPKTSVKETLPLPAPQPEPKKKSKIKRIVIILIILLLTLGGAGFGGYWWFMQHKPADANAPAADAGRSGVGVAQLGGVGSNIGSRQSSPGGSGSAATAGGSSAGGMMSAQAELPRSAGMVFPLPSVTVNLTDPGGRRYLKLSMEVEVNSDVSKDIKAQSPRIRDAIIMLLAGKNYNDIATPDGKVMLKAEVASRLNQIFGAQRVIRVYFTDFVVE